MSRKAEQWVVSVRHPGVDVFELYDVNENFLPGAEAATAERALLVQAAPQLYDELRQLTDLAERQGWKEYAEKGKAALRLARRGRVSANHRS